MPWRTGDVDVAIVWGPFAGYFASAEDRRSTITPVSPAMFLGVPFTYDISMARAQGRYGAARRIERRAARANARAIQDLVD